VLHDGVSFLVQRVPAIVPVRWVSDSTVKKLTIEGEAENRALQVVFMATSPLDVKPVLDFEAEEARILSATKRQPLALTVEESGCLSELGYLVDGYDKDYFDVLHLTGHATLQDGQPRFITETATGEAFYASAEDIAQELQFRLPKLIFLSGCRTGQAGNSGSVPSMAEELLKSGAKAVLGWGQKVLDRDATAAAAAVYQELSGGKQITEALGCTYQALIKNKARDWHLLRLYAAGNLPGSLVTPLRTRGRKPAPPLSVTTQFLDPAGKVKVPTRESFVGRRRQLQNCLRVLSQSTDEVGVLIHGMGGLGKSSLAARLCDRLPNFERVVWLGRIDEASLVSRLAEKLDDNEQRKSLQNYDEELKYRLRRVFQQLHEEAKPFLLVLDDFEGNLETSPPTPLRSGEGSQVPPFPCREGGLGGLGRLQSEAAEVLKALVWAIRDNSTSHRIIITCRYDFEFTQLQFFHKQPLDALQGADLQKKFNRLTAFNAKSQVDEALKSQAQKLADGNPRLLEWLDKILQNTTVDVAIILNRLAADPVELREQVLAEAQLAQMDTTMREMLSRGLVFELPVPRSALAAVCDTIANLEHYINRAVALGLLEVSHDEVLRVPRILPVQLDNGEVLHKQAAEVLYRLWGEEAETLIEEQCLEIHRLALRGKVDKIAVKVATTLTNIWFRISRFREVVTVCRGTLEIIENYRILYELAKSEQEIGLVEQAFEHYQKVLALCPPEDEIQKATTLHCLGMLKANRGEIEEAIALYQQSLAITEQIGDVKTKAMTLWWLGGIAELQGDYNQAHIKSELDGYSYVEKKVSYAGIEQRWLVVQSHLRRKADLRKLSQAIEKSLSSAKTKLKTLSQEKFACAADAMKALSKISKKFKHHAIDKIEITEKTPDVKGEKPDKYYHISATLSKNENAIDIENKSAGRFIIATNVLESKELGNDQMIREYKAQQSCERGFGFLKDPLFFTDSIFIKSPERIEALAMIMGLCLLVYTLAQRQIRAALSASQSTVKNQLGKSINNPTLRWIFQCFESIHLVTLNQETDISNLNPERNFILTFLPEDCRRYYTCIT